MEDKKLEQGGQDVLQHDLYKAVELILEDYMERFVAHIIEPVMG